MPANTGTSVITHRSSFTSNWMDMPVPQIYIYISSPRDYNLKEVCNNGTHYHVVLFTDGTANYDNHNVFPSNAENNICNVADGMSNLLHPSVFCLPPFDYGQYLPFISVWTCKFLIFVNFAKIEVSSSIALTADIVQYS